MSWTTAPRVESPFEILDAVRALNTDLDLPFPLVAARLVAQQPDQVVEGPLTQRGQGCDNPEATACWGARWMRCEDDCWVEAEVCVDPVPWCDRDLGCVVCEPDARSCEGNQVVECASDGSGTSVVDDCWDGMCLDGECI